MADLEEIWAWNSDVGGKDQDNKNFMLDMREFLMASFHLVLDPGLWGSVVGECILCHVELLETLENSELSEY